MTRDLLDTNIIRNVVKPQPSEALLGWMAARRDEDLFIASLTVAEIRRGILEKPRGKKRDALDAWFAGPEGPQAIFSGRILSFDDKAGLIWARAHGGGESRWATSQCTRHDHRRSRWRNGLCSRDRQ